MTQKNLDKNMISKIEKLLALGQSPNENEAKLAMFNANKLLTKYNLTMLDIEGAKGESDVDNNVIESGTRCATWKSHLINAISNTNYCQALINRKYKGYDFVVVGKAHNVLVVKNLYIYLVEAVNKWTKKNGGKGARAKNSYRLGMVAGLYNRLEEIKRQAMQDGLEIDGTITTALVVKNLHETELKANKEYMAKEYGKLSSKKTRSKIDGENYGKGHADSANVGLNAQIT